MDYIIAQMAVLVEILRPSQKGVEVDKKHYGPGEAWISKAKDGTPVIVRGNITSAEVWQNGIPQTLRQGEDPLEIRLAEGSTAKVSVDVRQPTE